MTSQNSLDTLLAFMDNPAPSVEECIEAYTPLTIGDYDDVHIAALLTHVRTRGETANDLLGAARAFLKAGRPFPITGEGVMDTAGTGGDGKNTINITTAASLVLLPGEILPRLADDAFIVGKCSFVCHVHFSFFCYKKHLF